MNLVRRHPLALSMLILLPLLACGPRAVDAPAGGEDNGRLVLRSYSVPEGLERRVAKALNEVLALEARQVGRVASSGEGIVTVLAPGSVQSGIADLIERLESGQAESSGPATVEVTYWLVLGRPDPDGFGSAGGALGDARLEQIRTPLETIAGQHGPLRFELLERIRATSLYDERGEISGRVSRLSQRISRIGGGIVGDIRIHLNEYPGGIETRVVLRPDQFLVLGESGIPKMPAGAKSDLGAPTLFYVLQTRAPMAG